MNLLKASQQGNLTRVQELINQGANVNDFNNHGTTALMFASVNGHHDIARLLIAAGAKVNHANKIGQTALTFASAYGKTKIVKLLMENGVNAGVADIRGQTPLNYANRHNRQEIVNLHHAYIRRGNNIKNFQRISRKAAKRSIRNRVYLDEVVGLPYDVSEKIGRKALNAFGKKKQGSLIGLKRDLGYLGRIKC
jgi:ankyrin repeat protein